MRYIIFPLTLLLPLACVFAQETSSLTSPLAGLSLPHAGVAKHEGSWDRGGGNGDARPVEPGKTITLLDYNGAGIIKRFWVTIAPRAEINVYPEVGHGFFADYRPSYNAAAAQDAWRRTLAFFRKHGV